MESVGTLAWPDYVVLAAFLVISLGIGIYHSLTGGRQRTTEEFVMADRRLAVIPTALSFFVSFESAIMILGMTAEMYMFGIQVLVWLPIGYTIGIVLTERLAVPWIYPLQLLSINDVSSNFIQLIQNEVTIRSLSLIRGRSQGSRGPRPPYDLIPANFFKVFSLFCVSSRYCNDVPPSVCAATVTIQSIHLHLTLTLFNSTLT